MPADSFKSMDSSSGSGSENQNDNNISSSPVTAGLRYRTDSEGSERVGQTRFVLPSTDGSPPKVLTMDEVVDTVKNIQNMVLIHEIALNPEFKLQPYAPPEDSLERRIKDIMHKAFWDVLRHQLNSTPPQYDHAIQLLTDIKECFPQIILEKHQRLLAHINEALDAVLIRQQAEQGVLNFRYYADFVIDIMAKTCAPIRDDEVKKLSAIEDVIETFRGILETMTVMKLDMANCLLQLARNDLVANSVEYEKQKFKECSEYYKLGFPITEDWLKRNQTQDVNGKICTADQTIYNAYMELLDWNTDNDLPEILAVDKERILKLGLRATRLCACASAISIASGVPTISQRTENKAKLAQQLTIILENVSMASELTESLENVAVQVIAVINSLLEENKLNSLDEVIEKTIVDQIRQISNKEFPVRSLMWKRLQTYFWLFLRLKSGLPPPPPPPGYEEFKDELEGFATALKRLVTYNHSVYGEYYREVLKKANTTNDSRDSQGHEQNSNGAESNNFIANLDAENMEKEDKGTSAK